MQAGRALEANLSYKNSLKFVQLDKGTLPHPHHFESHPLARMGQPPSPRPWDNSLCTYYLKNPEKS
jgi:hypothetical protein